MAQNTKPPIIFLGNGPLAEYALAVLESECQVLFHAHTAADLDQVCKLKRQHPKAHAVLASFGVIIPAKILELFESEGILNIHPSLLPTYRGPSPIETAILDGATDFGVSVMKLALKMDAGPIYWQTTLPEAAIIKNTHVKLVSTPDIPSKSAIYQALATAGAKWICQNIDNLPTPTPQDDTKATYTEKMTKPMGILHPKTDTATQTLRKIIAFQGFPKPKYAVKGLNCIILEAHLLKQDETALLPLECSDGHILAIDRLQPEGRKPMDAKSFLNGYAK